MVQVMVQVWFILSSGVAHQVGFQRGACMVHMCFMLVLYMVHVVACLPVSFRSGSGRRPIRAEAWGGVCLWSLAAWTQLLLLLLLLWWLWSLFIIANIAAACLPT